MGRPLIVRAEHQLAARVRAHRDPRRQQVERAARRGRAVLDLSGAGPHLDPIHPPDRWEVVGRGRCVGRGRDQHAVLHQRDRARPLGPTSAQPNVWAQPVPVLLLDRDTRHLAEHAVDVVAPDPLDGTRPDVVARSREVERAAPGQRLARRHNNLACVERRLDQHQFYRRRLPVAHSDARPRWGVPDHGRDERPSSGRNPRDLEPSVLVRRPAARGPLHDDVCAGQGRPDWVHDTADDVAGLGGGGEREEEEEGGAHGGLVWNESKLSLYLDCVQISSRLPVSLHTAHRRGRHGAGGPSRRARPTGLNDSGPAGEGRPAGSAEVEATSARRRTPSGPRRACPGRSRRAPCR